MNALLGVGQPVRRVVEGDPLANGAATALLAVPVPSGGSIAGTLLARRHEPRAFSDNEQDVLTRLARMAGAAMLSASRRIAFERGELDDLTGLPGGRRLSGDVVAAVRTADRAGMPVTVLAAHVLGLARLRTELGAPAADRVLTELTRAFAGVLRVGDVAYRIGEDEFALLLPATDGAGVPAIRERLEGVTAEVVAGLSLPGSPRQLALRTADVPLDTVRAGGDAVDAVTHALEVDRQKVRWEKAARPTR
jgi:GGDEF domain-containing protein